MSVENDRAEELFQRLSQEKKNHRRKIIRTVVITLIVVAAVLVFGVLALRRSVEQRFADAAAQVQQYQAQTGTIHTIVAGSGVLAEVDLEEITVPAGVKVSKTHVEAGDTVSKGDLLATVDIATVMTALSDVQEQLKDLDDQISDAKSDKVSSFISAGVAGRVKRVFAETGMDVSACMARNGALAVLSLDGYMAADLETDDLAAGEKVSVTRADGTVIEGKVESAAGGKATILVTDNGPAFDEKVKISTQAGKDLGTAQLYIHNPLAVTGYAGTISYVSVKENSWVDRGSTVVQLKDTAFSANYDSLLRDRSDLEEIQMELLTLYRDSALLAPMDGTISTVEFDEDLEYTFQTETDVMTLYPGKEMEITISIDETDIMALEEGQQAQITVESVSEDAVFTGSVTGISKVADTSTGVTRYSAEVTLEKAAGMLAGMTAEVDIQIEGVENALIIPIDALHRTSTIYYVYTQYDAQTRQYGGMKEVTIGMQNDTQVEILTGLEPGETVYYTEAPQDFMSFMMSNMGASGMGGGMPGGGMSGGGMSGMPDRGGMGPMGGNRGG